MEFTKNINYHYLYQMDTTENTENILVPANPGYPLDTEYKNKIAECINKRFIKHQCDHKLYDSTRSISKTVWNTYRTNTNSSLESINGISSSPKSTKGHLKNQETNISLSQSKTVSSSQNLHGSPDVDLENFAGNISSPSPKVNISNTYRNTKLETSKQTNKNNFKIVQTNSHSNAFISLQNRKKSLSSKVIKKKKHQKHQNHVVYKNCLDPFEQVVHSEVNIDNPNTNVTAKTLSKQNAIKFGNDPRDSYADSVYLQNGKRSKRPRSVQKRQTHINNLGTNRYFNQEIFTDININNAEENTHLQILKKKSNKNLIKDKIVSTSTSSSNYSQDNLNLNTMALSPAVPIEIKQCKLVDCRKDKNGFGETYPEFDVDGAHVFPKVIIKNKRKKVKQHTEDLNTYKTKTDDSTITSCQTGNTSPKQKSKRKRLVSKHSFEFRVENITSPIESSASDNAEDAPVKDVKDEESDDNYNWMTFCGEVQSFCSTSTSLKPEEDIPHLDSDSSDELDIRQKPLHDAVVIPVNITYDDSESTCNKDNQNVDSAAVNHIDTTHDDSEVTYNEVDQNLDQSFTELSYSQEVDDESFGSCELIAIDSYRSLLILDPISRVYFYGLLSFQLLSGEVEILGYSLQPFKTVDVYSPRGSSVLYVETNINHKLVKAVNESNFVNHNIPDYLVQKLCELSPGSAAIMCKKLEQSKISFLEKYIPQQIFPKLESPIDCIFQNTIGDWNVLKINPYWNTIAQELNGSCRLLICGGKSVGKSFLSRYLINKLIQKHKKILFIDLDPGQSEFTIPGCVSASIIDEPVFGPNYTHLREPYKCFFVPNVNISLCYMKYIQAVKDLVQSIQDFIDFPTIVNFMGYTRGLGFKLLAAVVAIVKPSTVLEIKSKIKARNYQEDLHHSTIITAAEKLAPEITSIPFFIYKSVSSMADDVQGWHLEPRQIREMSVLSYFGEILADCDCSLTHKNVPIYQFDLLKIKLIYDDKIVDPAVMNANLVALCSLWNASTYSCHGWGIVRAIDLNLNVCYVITPLSLEKLESVEYFLLGAVNLPPSVYMSARHCAGLIPYVATNIGEHGSIPKRTHLPRRNFNN